MKCGYDSEFFLTSKIEIVLLYISSFRDQVAFIYQCIFNGKCFTTKVLLRFIEIPFDSVGMSLLLL